MTTLPLLDFVQQLNELNADYTFTTKITYPTKGTNGSIVANTSITVRDRNNIGRKFGSSIVINNISWERTIGGYCANIARSYKDIDFPDPKSE